LTSLYTRRQLEGVIQRERGRADRVRGKFSLILFRARVTDRRSMLRLARLLLGRCRTIDEMGWFADDCLAALLPYTGSDGARAFASSALRLAEKRLIPASCRIYTYPSAWYFGDESGDDGNGQRAADAARTIPEDDLRLSDGIDDEPTDAGHEPLARGHCGAVAHSVSRLDATGGATAVLEAPPRLADEELQPFDLMPYLLQGASDAAHAMDSVQEVQSLILRRLPWWKRGIDIAGAGSGLLLLAPVMGLAAIAIKLTSRGPVIFKQRRAGLGGRPFWIYKFRTMVTDAEAQKAGLRAFSKQDGPAFKLDRDPRITRAGRILRETSLDELPQLWNVLKGEMSLVGPRPLPMDESAGCDQWQRNRLDVTPGLTCIWQVKGRSRVTFCEWMRMDVNYIRRRTFWHDLKILMGTIPAVLLRRGAR
jgi:lipopolysaccharide/colanic/teichoic acid biosynthesis glycosyltransferase